MRIIAHLDMDAFFAAVEERDNPRLKGKPIVVGADPKDGSGRGVVSTANYKAREYGIHSAMPISTAWRLAEDARRRGRPETIFVSVSGRRYGKVSRKIMAIVQAHVPVVEQSSIDEAYLDLSFTGNFAKAKKVCEEIKRDIKNKQKLTCSIGIGPNKLIAKIASDMQKPDGLTVVTESEAERFLEPLSIRKIPGIGPKTEMLFSSLNVEIIRDLKKLSREKLTEILGRWGNALYDKARGIDETPLVTEEEVKSIGEQETFPEDTNDLNFVTTRMKELAKSVIEKFERSGFKSFRTVVITVRFADFETKTRSRTLNGPASSLGVLEFESLKLLLPFFDSRENSRRKKFRLVGVRVKKLE